MKMSLCMLLITFLASASLLAAETKGEAAKKQTKTKPAAAGTVETRTLTGSYIKQQVRKNGDITDGASLVTVLDENAIRNSGASDVRQLLVRRGGFR